MKIRSLFLLMIIAALLGMVTACDDLGKDPNSSGTDPDYLSGPYTVSFEANGGSPAPQSQTISWYGKVTEPAYMTKAGYGFGGWYTEAAFNNQWNFNDHVTANLTLYAKWVLPITVTGEDLLEKLQWINSNAASNNTYILEVSKDELIGPQNLSYSGKSNITIQLKGTGGLKTIECYGSSLLFTIGNNVTLILDENIVLKGSVSAGGGNLIMNNGSKITGGGVSVRTGTFTMNSGEISGNTFGGVSVRPGTFTMNGGKISGNTAYGGGGVSVRGGTFTMNGGEISGNTSNSGGGGVYVEENTDDISYYRGITGTFTMTGGVISGNTVNSSSSYGDNGYGGGVYVGASSSFEKTGGIITGYSSDTANGNVVKEDNDGNVLDNRGHAVYVEHINNNFIRRKETTAGQGDNLKYIRNEPNPPTISGAWDE